MLIKPDPGSTPAVDAYLAQQICATGKVETDGKHTPFIAITGANGLEVKDPRPVPSLVRAAAQACESGIASPRLTKEVKPDYPEDEFRQRAQAHDRSAEWVFLQAVVDETGHVAACRTVYSRSVSFSRAAEAALKQWRFKPATRGGAPVTVVVQVEMAFTF